MPQYEVAMILRPTTKAVMAACIKRNAEAVFKNGGLVRKFENLGQRPLPFKLKGVPEGKGNYFIMYCDLPGDKIVPFRQDTRKDDNILRTSILRSEEECLRPCEVGQCYFSDMNNDDIFKKVMRFGTFQKRINEYGSSTMGIRRLQLQADIKKKQDEDD